MDAGTLLDTALQHSVHRTAFTQMNKDFVMTSSVPATALLKYSHWFVVRMCFSVQAYQMGYT